jgi:hypothetical protein
MKCRIKVVVVVVVVEERKPVFILGDDERAPGTPHGR